MTDTKCIETIRCLAVDCVDSAKSGHPGAPMGMAPIAHLLFSEHMNFDPDAADWINRDRFVLSNGHGCALLYSMLHLTGYSYMSMDQLKNFRQLHSKTPGHPEREAGHPGVEVTTGPLGQGISQAVGMALAQRHFADRFNRPGHEVFDNFTYVFCGDGCLQEGVACEATSLAGHLKLGKLVVVYDDNQITIDGPTSLSYSEDVAKKFEALGWHTTTVVDGNNDLAAMRKALDECKAVTDKPSMVLLKTVIGYGSKIQGTAKVHGAPLAQEDIKNLKQKAGFDPEVKFHVGDDVYATYKKAAQRGKAKRAAWLQKWAAYAKAFPAEAKELEGFLKGELPANWTDGLPVSKEGESVATRKCSEIALGAIQARVNNVIGGSADLTGSNLTKTKGCDDITPESAAGRYIRFGIREHGMAAIANGIAAYGGLIPFTATFYNFVTYAWGAVRLGALSNLGTIHVATHDSIGLGEDGPTHQPVEVSALCRATPNLYLFRPCDQTETTASYVVAIERRTSQHIVALSRQGVPMLGSTSVEGVRRGGYAVYGQTQGADVIIVSTGTEVSLAIEAAKLVTGLKVAVVSLVCTRLFDEQPLNYRQSVFPVGVPVLAVEPYNSYGWERYSHYFMGLKAFGGSAPAKKLYEDFGLTKEKIAAKAQALQAKLGKNAPSLHPLEL